LGVIFPNENYKKWERWYFTFCETFPIVFFNLYKIILKLFVNCLQSQNTDNPYEKWRNSKTGSPNKVAKPDGKGGFVDVDRPPNWYDHKRPDGGNISKKK
jgi:hypothetical protein